MTAGGERVTPLKQDPRLVLKGTRRLPGKITWPQLKDDPLESGPQARVFASLVGHLHGLLVSHRNCAHCFALTQSRSADSLTNGRWY